MKLKKIFITFIIFIVLISSANQIFATNKITNIGKEWIELGESGNTLNTDAVTTGFQEIAGLLLGIGIFVAVAVGIILGIKFMFSTAEGKAEVSKLLTPFIIGTVLIVGALVIWKAAIEILDIY